MANSDRMQRYFRHRFALFKLHNADMSTPCPTSKTRTHLLALIRAGGCAVVLATTTSAWSTSIYTCVDAQGRKITADRPIRECIDREQRELNPSGSVKRIVPPSLTAEERARDEARKRADAEAAARQNEDKRREQLLVSRYPNEQAHQRARGEALQTVDDMIATAHRREQELDKQRADISAEMEFYQKDPSKAPEWLKHRQANNAQQRAALAQYFADQEREKARINARFDDELKLLQRLWSEQARP